MSIVRDRVASGVLVATTVLGVWVGLTGPSTSPVQAPVPATSAVPPATTP